MSSYAISKIYPGEKRNHRLINELLAQEGIRLDANLDYTCAMFDDDLNVIGTGSCFGNTLRCMAVSSAHQGEGLMNEIVTHLLEVQYARGNNHLFLYTKCNSAKFFASLGFYEIKKIENQLVFMENKKTGFTDYLNQLTDETNQYNKTSTVTTNAEDDSIGNVPKKVAAIVMNANPFTLGHQYLVEKASSENDLVHLFIVSEDASLVPFHIRKRLVMEGTSHLNNICYHDSGPYMISNATFPSYFQKDEQSVIEGHALLDLSIFQDIAKRLDITNRYVGEEPNSFVTNLYNQIMSEQLPQSGISCTIVPRKEFGNSAISASTVRQAVKEGNMDLLEQLVPTSTLAYFLSDEALPVIQTIRKEADVIHY